MYLFGTVLVVWLTVLVVSLLMECEDKNFKGGCK